MKNVLLLAGIFIFASAFANVNPEIKPFVLTQAIQAPPVAAASVLNLKLFIEGYYEGNGMMKPVLKNQGQGTSTTVTDNITVELHGSSSPYDMVATTSAVLNTDGTAACSFDASVSGSYYIVVKHRNAITTWSSQTVAVGAAAASYDFTTANTKAFDNNMKDMGSGKWAFYSGDVNQDGIIDLTDILSVHNDATAFKTGFNTTDLNGDGVVDLSDILIANNNSTNFVTAKKP